jgi:Ni/Fe-hydrogenase subunit HybB-like protein
MAIFGLVYIFYLVLLLLEIQIYDRGVVLSPPLGASSTQKAMTVLSCLGIPVACIFHGYVGLVFSSIKANFWWCTLFTPIVFLTSGVVSGIAMLIVIYLFRKDARLDCIHMLCKWLGGFAILTLSAELIHILTLTHLGREKWAITATLLTDQLAVSFIGVQMILGILAIVILGVIVVRGTSLRPRPYKTLACIASLGLLAQVFAMRWNVVLGGQMFSKSLRGLRDDYSLQFLGENGILIAAIIFTIPFILLGIFNRLSPLFPVPPNQDISKL